VAIEGDPGSRPALPTTPESRAFDVADLRRTAEVYRRRAAELDAEGRSQEAGVMRADAGRFERDATRIEAEGKA
jgi:hypothetical protein